MENALQEQLLKTGLADSSKPERKTGSRKPQQRKGKQQGQARQGAKGRTQPLEAHIPLPDLIHHYALPRWGGDTPYHFTEGERIRHIWVTRQQQRQLADGEAGVVVFGERYEVVPRAVAEQVRERDSESLRLLHPRKDGA